MSLSKLKVKGIKLTDETGEAVQLRGISTLGLRYPEYITRESFETFRDEWGANTIRLAMYTDESGGYYYKSLKDDIEKLTSRQWLTLPDGTMKTISWIGDAIIVPLSDTIYIKFNENLQPYLFDLREKYTQYRLQNVLVFRGKYAIRMYEILRSHTTQHAIEEDEEKEVDLTLEQLRYLLAVDSYPRWADFRRFVIDPAIMEINERSEELHIEYFPMKGDGKRSIEKINFVITRARVGQQFRALQKRKEKLDHRKI